MATLMMMEAAFESTCERACTPSGGHELDLLKVLDAGQGRWKPLSKQETMLGCLENGQFAHIPGPGLAQTHQAGVLLIEVRPAPLVPFFEGVVGDQVQEAETLASAGFWQEGEPDVVALQMCNCCVALLLCRGWYE